MDICFHFSLGHVLHIRHILFMQQIFPFVLKYMVWYNFILFSCKKQVWCGLLVFCVFFCKNKKYLISYNIIWFVFCCVHRYT